MARLVPPQPHVSSRTRALIERRRYVTRRLMCSMHKGNQTLWGELTLHIPARPWGDHMSKRAPDPGTRWITVHPNGENTTGVPIMIRESKESPGSYYVVGGAGGKMNHMKLTGVKSKEQHEKEQKERQREKRQKKKEEEQELAKEGKLDKKKAMDEAVERASAEKDTDRIKAKMQDILPLMGMNPAEYAFNPDPETVKGIKPDSAAYAMLEYQYYRKLETQMDRNLDEMVRQQLMKDRERLENEGISFALQKEGRGIDLAAAFEGQKQAEAELGDIDHEIENARTRGDEDAVDRLEKRREEAQEEHDQHSQTIDEAGSTLSIDEASGYKPNQGKGYDATTKNRAIQSMIESGELDHEALRQQAENDNDGEQALSDVANIVASGGAIEQVDDDGQPIMSPDDLCAADMEARRNLLNKAAEHAEEGDYDKAFGHWKRAEALVEKWRRRADKAHAKDHDDSKMTGSEYLGLVAKAVHDGRNNAKKMSQASKQGATQIPEELQQAKVEYDQMKQALAAKKKYDAMKANMQRKKEQAKEEGAAAGYAIDTDAINDKFDVDALSSDQALVSAEEALRIQQQADINSALLKEVEESPELMSQLDISRTQLQRAMAQHVSAGAFAGFGNATMLGAGDILADRALIDTFGVKGAASILATHLRDSLDDDRYNALVEGIEAYHGEEGTRRASDAVARAKEAYAEARDIAFGDIEDPSDPVSMQYLNDKRRALLEHTMHDLGRTIGELRSHAELLNALKKTKKGDKDDPLRRLTMPMGDADEDSIIQNCAALGLERDDYQISQDVAGKVVFIQGDAISKLARSDLTQEEIDASAHGQAIKTGGHDESGWLPAGIARRVQSTMDGPTPEPPVFGVQPEKEHFAGLRGDDLHEYVSDYIGSHVADGRPVMQVVADLQSAAFHSDYLEPASAGGVDMFGDEIPGSNQAEEIDQAIKKLLPQFDHSKDWTPDTLRAFEQEREEAAQQLAEQYRTKQGLSADTLHTQGVAMDRIAETDMFGESSTPMGNHTVEAVHRALAKNPAAVLAFKSPMELNPKEKNALRDYWWKHLSPEGKEASSEAKKRQQAEKDKKKDTDDDLTASMFGDTFGDSGDVSSYDLGTDDPRLHQEYGPDDTIEIDVWGTKQKVNAREWQEAELEKRRQNHGDMFGNDTGEDGAMGAGDDEAKARHAWDRYLQAHGSNQDLAYRSLQEHMQGEFAQEFAGHYNRLTGEPLKLGKTALSMSDAHQVGLAPSHQFEERLNEMRNPMAREMAEVGRGASGKFVAGARGEAAAQSLRVKGEEQRALFQEKEAERSNKSMRATLGHRAERQIAGIVNEVGHAWNPKADPVSLFPVSMGDDSEKGKRFYKQQRAVKLIEHQKKVGLWFGAGSGKSLTTLAAFTHLEDQGQVKRGIYAVPSVVQKQFGGEAQRFLDPTKQRADGRTGYKWHAEAGASREERHAAYRDQNTDFVVVTHQGIRDDAIHALSEHQGIDHGDTVDWFNGLSRSDRAQAIKGAFDHMGWHNLDYLYVDEAHYTSNRIGKENSTMANVMDAIGDNVSHQVLGSGTPVKNDASEAYDYLSKLDPDRFSDRGEFMRRYGSNTQSHREALQRLTSRYFYQDRVESGVEGHVKKNEIKLSGHQRTQYDAAQQAFNAIKMERQAAKKEGRPIDSGILTEHMRTLSPNSFADLDEGDHEDKARSLLPAIGTIKEAAFNRIINGGKFETNAKMQHISQMADQYRNATNPRTGKKGVPGVVFARNLETIDELKRGLEAQGHRVATLTGTMTGDEKDAARRAFAPDSKRDEDATADIMILSDAGNTGLNLQRGGWLVHVDTPMTSPVKEQRDARINRIGQQADVDLHELITDTPFDGAAQRRLARKAHTSHVFQDPSHTVDDTGLAAHVNAAYKRATGQKMRGQAVGEDNRQQRRAAVETAQRLRDERKAEQEERQRAKKQEAEAEA
jgi:hypothetical protein